MKRVAVAAVIIAVLGTGIFFMLSGSSPKSQELPSQDIAPSNTVTDSSPHDEAESGEEASQPSDASGQSEEDFPPGYVPPPERFKVSRSSLDFSSMTPEEKEMVGIEDLIIDYLLGKADIENIKNAAARLREVSNNITDVNGAYNRAGLSYALYYYYCRDELLKAGIECEPLDKVIKDPVSYSYMFHRYPGEKGRLFAAECLYTQQDRRLQEIKDSPFMVLAKICGMNFSDNRDVHYEKMLKDMGLKKGMSVADIGGGLGRLTWIEKKMVGPEGHAYLAEIDYSCEDFIDYVREYQPDFKELGDVEFIKADLDDPKLPGKMDCITFSEVHVLRDEDWKNWGSNYMKLLHEKYLKPGGKVAFYEGLLNSNLMIKAADSAERKQIVCDRLSSAGFKNISFSTIPYHDELWIVVAEI
ncbi:MAG: class I SAM-dependent methyltransferase [bacterium]|nr:class I SAM-dependent methyltransferase [bacterium]